MDFKAFAIDNARKEFSTGSWDSQSGVRERLALLAAIGPNLDESKWGYNPSRDIWYYCGGARNIQGRVKVEVCQEARESLNILGSQGLDPNSAMAIIGYPNEGPR